MKTILVAAIIAAASVCSPAVLITSSSAMAVDCTNASDPGNRPGGYCSLLLPGTSLSTPVTSGGTAPRLIHCEASNDISEFLPRNYGDRLEVALNLPECEHEWEPDPCSIDV